MLPMIELGALLLFGVAIVAVIVAFTAILKAIFWVVLMPFRLVFWLLGAVLNDVDTSQAGYKYYSYVYGYASEDEPERVGAGA